MITFIESGYAEAAVTELNSTELDGRKIHLRIDDEGVVDPDGTSSIYVGNLPWQVYDEELQAAFANFKPYYCRVMKNMSGRSRGFAIIKFCSVEDSDEAILSMHKYEIGGRAIEVRIMNFFYYYSGPNHLMAIIFHVLFPDNFQIIVRLFHFFTLYNFFSKSDAPQLYFIFKS